MELLVFSLAPNLTLDKVRPPPETSIAVDTDFSFFV